MNNSVLNYPWNLGDLSMKKIGLLKKIIKNKNQDNYSLKVLGGYTFNNVSDWIKIFSFNNGININIESSDWGKGYACSLNYLSQKTQYDIIIVVNSWVDLISKDEFTILNNDINEILNIYKTFIDFIFKNKVNCVFSLFDYPNFLETSDLYFSNKVKIDHLNTKLIKLIKPFNNIALIDPNSHLNYANIKSNFDERNWSLYGNLYDLDQSIFIGYQYSIPIRSFFGTSKKLLILDLDNTIWGGVIGDSNISDIKINSEDPEGRLFLKFQYFIKSLKKKGILLALCSKNNESIVVKAFNELNMPLKLSDFIAKRINWNNKHENILDICKELNLSLDSVVFCDDNPTEREEVLSFLPAVSCPNIGKDPSKYINILDINQYFKNYLPLSNEDKKRSQSYKILKKQLISKSKFKNQNDFIKSLKLEITIENLNKKNIDRILQLINKTNQFNLTTKRVTRKFLETDIKKKWKFVIRVKDKFGDHGIISFIYGTTNKDIITIENWVLSCRVFNKNIEGSILLFLITKAFDFKHKEVNTMLIQNSKNIELKNILTNIGFKISNSNLKNIFYNIKVHNYEINKNLIKINDIR